MAITHSSVPVAEDTTGTLRQIETVTLAGLERRQVYALGDPDSASANAIASVKNTDPAGTDYGLVVREAGGTTVHSLLTVLGTNATVVKNSPGRLKRASIYNLHTALLFVKFHNVSTTPTAGSTAVFFPVPCQAGTWTHIGSGYGMDFSVGIAYTTVFNVAPTDTSNVPANSLVIICERV